MTPKPTPPPTPSLSETTADPTRNQTTARRQARQWLKTLHVSPTPELVEGLAPLLAIYPKKSLLAFHAGRLLKKGTLPTEQAMLKLLWGELERIIYSIKALEARIGLDPFMTPEDESEILAWVDAFWGTRGEGPRWSELAEHFQWSHAQRTRFIHYLAARGLVTFTSAPRSLRTTRDTAALDLSQR